MEKKARVIAFYLPQFHSIPENDKWWGKGFTEWTNVGRAKALFKGHYQPRVPADLGYYSLLDNETRVQQANLAQQYGVEGFMYWHYWFGNGKRILEKPLDMMLKSRTPDFPFCLGWANHSWSNRSWNPEAQRVKVSTLIKQEYPGMEDHKEHFNFLLSAFNDSRYIKVGNKPLFYIYDPLNIPNIGEVVNVWREMAEKNGLDGLYLVARGDENQFEKLTEIGFDAINPNLQWKAESIVKGKWMRLLHKKFIDYFGGYFLDKYNYKEIIKYLIPKYVQERNILPSVIPQWDRTPRSGRLTTLYHGSTPGLFSEHLKDTIKKVNGKKLEENIIFLKSWNEWAEGNYVEPDLKYGHGFLEAIKDNIL